MADESFSNLDGAEPNRSVAPSARPAKRPWIAPQVYCEAPLKTTAGGANASAENGFGFIES